MRAHLRPLVVLALTAALLLLAAPAFAHVTLRTDNPAPEAFAKYTVRVPNERDDAATTKVEVQLPDGFEPGGYQPVPGWDITIADGVMTVEGGRIEPGQFQEFSFSARNPAEAGDLVFPSIQTYESGEEVRWVGEPDSDEPAPVVAIAGEADGHGHAEETEPADTAAAPTEAAAAAPAATDEPAAATGTPTLSIAALVAALVALGVAGGAFARAKR